MNENLLQALLLVTSGLAVSLLATKNKRRQFIGCVIGVVGAPLWWWTTLAHKQWGVFILSLVFTYSYVRGAWVRRKRDADDVD